MANTQRNRRRSVKARRVKRPPAGASERFVIREVLPRDLAALYALSKHLDSVNFPHDKKLLSALIGRSRDSFNGKTKDVFRREYMFVMEGVESGAIAGTSMIFAQHGHPDAPHVFFDVVQDERYSVTLDRHFGHTTLRIGLSYRGPTEIGALVLDPALRSMGLGKPLSYVRFLFIAMFRERFQRSVIAELMPPLLPDGRSLLWEHLGKHFTGLTYQEADKLSHSNKEFITSLFPQTPLYASLLPPEVRALIGEVGDETKGVRRMLEAIGFEYSERIDPFDGGPHFEAATDDITLVKNTIERTVATATIPDEAEADELDRKRGEGERERPSYAPLRCLVGRASKEGPCHFRATVAAVHAEGHELVLSPKTRGILEVAEGDPIWAVPV
ncbi:arginine N-succinyltransferase [Myxococcota bacterium]|nr:arginine N-succinyltransferase [Myxococcota bacterium]